MAFILRKTLVLNNIRQYHRHLALTDTSAFKVKNKEALLKVLPEVIDTVCKGPTLSTQPKVANWVKDMLEYILLGASLRRANDVTAAYVMFESPENITEEKIHSSHILGWCTEMTYAFGCIVDDIMDSASLRRNKLCWYRRPNVGVNAVNDTILLHQAILEILEIKFGHTPEYTDLVKIVNNAIYVFGIGQQLENFTVYTKKRNNLDCFTFENFKNIAIRKAAYATTKYPLLLGLTLMKDRQKKAKKEWIDICLDIGPLYQIHANYVTNLLINLHFCYQNDYSDVYEKESESGKTGNDIQEGKLTWLALTALPRCNEQQLATFKEFYGSPDPEHVKQIKQIYDDLKLPKLYEESESKMYNELLGRIRALPTEPERKFFLNLLGEWYKAGY
ncbi:farnesyl pyrophosphate synthase 1-like [Trichoplusia ni]|uniref:Farnesyl pyrophosphate synthase 1-like n=1 Tax=Trichoplusia ni TaxID=7111 RepID=A0A7E5WD35_TRINI|nr:farnesyl pyrophosphate synthase 1-like [Trichoplusia ni]